MKRHILAIMVLAGVAATWLGAGSSVMRAQGPVQPAWGAGGQQYVNPTGEWLGWLGVEQVKKELELVDAQQEKIRKIQEESMKKMQQLYPSLQDVAPEKRMDRYYEKSRELAAETDKRLAEVLLPQQRDRLRQIVLQFRLRGEGVSSRSLAGDDLSKALGISEAQKERLREKEKQLQEKIQEQYKELYKKMEQAREDAREELLEVLTESQRAKLRELQGTRFEIDWTKPVQPKK